MGSEKVVKRIQNRAFGFQEMKIRIMDKRVFRV
jgi:hypothetical protein